MTRRPMLILNGKPRRMKYGIRYCQEWRANDLCLKLWTVEIDHYTIAGARMSFSTRPSGRRMIYVDVPEVE